VIPRQVGIEMPAYFQATRKWTPSTASSAVFTNQAPNRTLPVRAPVHTFIILSLERHNGHQLPWHHFGAWLTFSTMVNSKQVLRQDLRHGRYMKRYKEAIHPDVWQQLYIPTLCTYHSFTATNLPPANPPPHHVMPSRVALFSLRPRVNN
jgi:hypothetical protein